MSPLTDPEIRADGERRYFYRRLEQRAALPIDWTDAEVRAFVVCGIQPERVRQAGEQQWARREEDARQAQERQERNRGGVVELRNGSVGWRGEKMPPRAVKLVRRYFEQRSMIVRRPQPRQPGRRPQSRVARATASGADPPKPGDDDPEPVVGPPLTRAEREFLRSEVDRRIRERLSQYDPEQAERDRALFADEATS